jgi:site-specific DNA-cytosine methylase
MAAGEGMKPLLFDLFCGLFGWGSAFAETGYRVVGFDIEDQCANFGKVKPEGCELVLRDIRSINGAELVKTYGAPACIVASPPCQEFSYMAMPWSKAKDKMRKILADPAEQKRLTDLFNQCFRIQREVSAAAGHYVPMVVENVRGAQRWVGKARWNFGSFYLWGDVPALMPIPHKKILKYGMICAAELKAKHGDARVALRDGVKLPGMDWSDHEQRGKNVTGVPGRNKGVSFTDAAGYKVASEEGRRTDPGKGARFTTRDCGNEGSKGFTPNGERMGDNIGPRQHAFKSSARKQASAEIAKIPPSLASWIAKTFKPK